MLRRIAWLPAVALFALAASGAQAGLLSSFLTDGGAEDVLIDESVARVIDNGDLEIGAGDIVQGVLRISSTNNTGVVPADEHLLGVFSFEISAAHTATSLGTIWEIGALANANASSLETALGLGLPTGTMVAVMSRTGTTYNPLAQTWASLVTDLTTNYTYEAALGLDSSLPAGSENFFQVRVTGDSDGNGKVSFAEIAAANLLGDSFGNESAGLSVLAAPGLPTGLSQFLPVGLVAFTEGAGLNNLGNSHDLRITGRLFGAATNTLGWQIEDDTRVTVNAVPEPTSMTLLGLGAISACGLGLRRRRQTA